MENGTGKDGVAPLTRAAAEEEWRGLIGLFMVNMGRIEFLTHAYKTRTAGGLSKTWTRKTLSARLDSLSATIPKQAAQGRRLAQSFQDAKELVPVRNTVAHGSFSINAVPVGQPHKLLEWHSTRSLMSFHMEGSEEVLNIEKLEAATEKSRELCDQISANLWLPDINDDQEEEP